MTYCLGMLLDEGLVLISDSRTNAGVDSIASYRKTFIFDEADDRKVIILVAGNLATTQNVISRLEERLEDEDPSRNIYQAVSMFEIARIVGGIVREVFAEEGEALQAHGIEFSASFIVAGQIRGRRMRMFNVYTAGNFVEATSETPYIQIGETKYGKPILERVLTQQTPISEAIKCGLVSFDSTINANLSVGLPINLTILRRDNVSALESIFIGDDDTYFADLVKIWGEGIRNLFRTLPDPEW